MKSGNTTNTIRKKFVLSFFGLYAFSLGVSIISILFLFNANIVSMDQSQALSDLRLVQMYLDIKYPGEWTIRGDSVFKGDTQVSGNYRIVSELARYIRPDTWLSFHAGSMSNNPEKLSIHRMGFFMRLVTFLKKDDQRLNIKRLGLVKPILPETKIAPQSIPFDDTFLIPGGIIQILQTTDHTDLGWIQLQRQSLGHGSLERLVFALFLIVNLVMSVVILIVVYRIIYKLSEPVQRLIKKQAKITVENEILENISRKDPLTELLNRRGLYLALREKDFSATGACSAVAIIDLDDFKKINDTYGHECGDYVLKEVSRLITGRIRQEDVACRWGGEEFLVFYSSADIDTLSEIANRIRQTIADYVCLYDGHHVQVTITIGFSPCRDLTDFDACIHRADGALYYGKRNGKNQVVRG